LRRQRLNLEKSQWNRNALRTNLSIWVGMGVILSCSCSYALVLNNPYSHADVNKNIYYSSFAEQPKTLDPGLSYNANELQFIGQIYEPLLQYDYLKRPYTLIPLVAASMPVVKFSSQSGSELKKGDAGVAYSVYTLRIQPGVLYQPHPALAQDANGNPKYLNLAKDYLDTHHISKLSDFKHTGTRELTAMDYVYQIKRLASPRVNSPIFCMMSEHIQGFNAFNQILAQKNQRKGFFGFATIPTRRRTCAG
jgi:oligopeptide transport system substrate-binding protein